VPENRLRKYNLTLDQIADIVRKTALELPGGGVRTKSGEILLRTKERRDFADEFRDVPIIQNSDGSKVYLGEMATVKEMFEETDEKAFFNGKNAIRLDVFRVGEQTPIGISGEVKEYIEKVSPSLPNGIEIATWNDQAEIFKDRIQLLLKNAALGLLLVLLLLGLFLEVRLAFWVMLGIPISIIGSFLFIPLMGASINMVSLFAFIVTLGIIVDDAIVVGENVFDKREEGIEHEEASIKGTIEIATPVTFAVLTNIAAFLPLFFVPGSTGKIFLQIPAIVVSVFILSLIESLFVLPEHLSRAYEVTGIWKWLDIPSTWFNKKLKTFVHGSYLATLKGALKYRYLTLATAISILLLTLTLIGTGYVPFSYLPRVDSDLVTAQVVLPFGVPLSRAEEVQERLVLAANESKNGKNIARGIFTQIGTPLKGLGPALGKSVPGRGSHLVGAQVFLVPSDEREMSGLEFAENWREMMGPIPGAETATYNATVGVGGKAVDIELSHQNIEVMESAAFELGEALSVYKGVRDIDNGVHLGKPQLSFTLKPEARNLGITVNDLARQVRSAFYGSEALRQQRGRNEVKVMVRLPKEEREEIHTVEGLILRTPKGGEIGLTEAAEVKFGRSYTRINRTNGRRSIAVTADVDEAVGNANKILRDVEKKTLLELKSKYPSLSYSFQGEQKEQNESLESLSTGFMFALVIIYALLAVPFKSYVQPLIVMLSIPFGIIGAIIGHVLLGYELSIISMFGIIALAGVVVNDSLVLIVTANRKRDGNAYEALTFAGPKRFRPILLTSLTTFFGLAPMIFETSMQARFLIPMAISLGFGVLFATFITLLIVPCLYLIVEDFR
jgi:multidrug efflux pump subunit AcrB